MTIQGYSDALGIDLVIRRYAQQDNRWTAQFENCEVKDTKSSPILAGVYGSGDCPQTAVRDYIASIGGKTLVFKAYSEARAEYRVPYGLTYSEAHP